MFFPEGQIRVHLYGQPCDMRRSFDGLSAMVRHELQADPTDGSLYCFINRRATQMRVLYFDRSGFCVRAASRCESASIVCACERTSPISSADDSAVISAAGCVLGNACSIGIL